MRILYIAPAETGEHVAVPSLRFLPHALDRATPDTSALVAANLPDVVVLDATLDLSLAPVMRERLDTVGISAPLIIALTEGGCAAVAADWRATDIIVATATPAETEARLRLALAAGSGAGEGLGSGDAGRAGDGGAGGLGAAGGFGSAGADGNVDGEPSTEFGPLQIDTDSYTVTVKGTPVALTFKEFELLRFLASNPERVFTRTQLLQDVWGSDYFGGTRTVDVHIRRLRAKLGPELDSAIHTVRNVGFLGRARCWPARRKPCPGIQRDPV